MNSLEFNSFPSYPTFLKAGIPIQRLSSPASGEAGQHKFRSGQMILKEG